MPSGVADALRAVDPRRLSVISKVVPSSAEGELADSKAGILARNVAFLSSPKEAYSFPGSIRRARTGISESPLRAGFVPNRKNGSLRSRNNFERGDYCFFLRFLFSPPASPAIGRD